MRANSKIITVGLCPSWDTVCRVDGIDWGQHKQVSSSSSRPAGKALNISRALAWMGTKSIAAGLWGQQDYEQMLREVQLLRGLIKVKMTAVVGATRQNVTVVDTVNRREMHLRNLGELASEKTLRKLQADLGMIVNRDSACVFAGSMPPRELLGDVVRIVNSCRSSGAKIAVDTSGVALSEIVGVGGIWLIKSNVRELCELLSERVKDSPVSLAKAGRKLLEKVDIVLISRGKEGSIVVTKEGAWQGKYVGAGREVLSTVGCGDYLLAGFLEGLRENKSISSALRTAIKVATVKAWGWTEQKKWTQTRRQIKVKVGRCKS